MTYSTSCIHKISGVRLLLFVDPGYFPAVGEIAYRMELQASSTVPAQLTRGFEVT